MNKKKLFSFILFSSLIFLLGTLSIPILTSADGMLIELEDDGWDYLDENGQQAFINYKDGIQEMAISIGIEDEDHNDLVWLFPIPSDPKDITVDIVGELPSLFGYEISNIAISNLEGVSYILRQSQIYPALFDNWSRIDGVYILEWDDEINNGAIYESAGIFVHEYLEKEGMVLEVITARTSGDLFNYLESKGMEITSDSIPILDNYIGKDYSFIVSWINPLEKVASKERGVFVTFPTSDIYFPMLPTSVYGDKVVPVKIRVSGHVSPKIFESIKDYSDIDYYINGRLSFSKHHDDNNISKITESFREEDYENYTRISINAPSKLLTEDLWISNETPPKINYLTFFINHPVIITIVLFILSSVIAGLLSGLIFFKELRRKPIKLILIGLSNLFTIFGVILTVLLINTKKSDDKIKPVLTELKQKGYLRKRRVATVLFFIAIPILILGITKADEIITEMHYYPLIAFLAILIVYLLPITALIKGYLLRRVEIKDRELFDQLESSGYSTWSLQSKDRLKFAFIPFFSISFLAILWSLIELIKLTI